MVKSTIHEPSEEQGKEKHVPNILITDSIVSVNCGKDLSHPSTDSHYIVWIKIFGTDKDKKLVELKTINLEPGSKPEGNVNVNLGEYLEISALIYCNLHGLWYNTIDSNVCKDLACI